MLRGRHFPPDQYYAPIFRELLAASGSAHSSMASRRRQESRRPGFARPSRRGTSICCRDHPSSFLSNVSRRPGTDRFFGCDAPEIGAQLDAGRFDAVLVVGWYLKAFIQTVWAARLRGLPVLVRGDSHLQTPRSSLTRAAKALAYPPLLRVFDDLLSDGGRAA